MIYEIKLHANFITWSAKLKGNNKKNSRRHKASPLTKRTKRIQNTIKKKLLRLNPQPKWFVTLILPDKRYFRKLTRTTRKKMNKLFAKLKREYLCDFPGGYMFWVAEYSFNRGVHLHCCCHTDEKISKAEMKHWFRDSWCNISNNYEDDVVHVSNYNRNKGRSFHPNYLTKKSKLKNKMKLVKCFGKFRPFGIIGRGNYQYDEPERLNLSSAIMLKLRPVLVADLAAKSNVAHMPDTSSWMGFEAIERKYRSQFYKIQSDCGLHFFNSETHEEIKTVLERYGVL